MYSESSTRNEDYNAALIEPPGEGLPPRSRQLAGLQEAIESVMLVRQVGYPDMPQIIGQYSGHLTTGATQAYETLEPTLKRLGIHAYFTTDEATGDPLITVINGRFETRPRPWWPNLLLFVLTVLSLLFVGAGIQAGLDDRAVNGLEDLRLWQGWQYAVSMILILGSHELGHYFAARRHKVKVTLPYFIPMPLTFFGTLGAFIQLREPMRNRRVLFDVGIAGPLAGLIFAIPILFYGLSTSEVTPPPPEDGYYQEGNSVFYASAKAIVFGRFLPDKDTKEDVLINQFAQAGWVGLFITALNLIPLGQLDGGHVIYTLLGRRASRLFWPIVAVFAFLAVGVSSIWILWTLLLVLLGRFYARPLEDITPLDNGRRILGYLALVILVLIFIPDPMRAVTAMVLAR
jgi:membrane-associated protease RseP (regulator of RpoE activity)